MKLSQTQVKLAGFVAVAALIGVLEHRAPEPYKANVIEVTPSMRAFVREQIASASSVGPTETNYDKALSTYLNDEVLYREGLRLGLEKDDLIIRRRVIQKMKFLIGDMTPIKKPTHQALQDWLNRNPALYQTGQAIQFEQVYFSRQHRGDQAMYDAREALQQLRAGKKHVQGDPFIQLDSDREISHQDVQRTLGTWLTDRIFREPVGVWSDPIVSPMGVFLVKVIAVNHGRLMTVEEGGERLRSDYEAEQRKVLNQASIKALKATYKIKVVN